MRNSCLYIIIACIIASCAPRSIREAQDVVAQADSLWQAGQMYGIDAGDSTTLAQAYETLKEHSVFSRQQSEYAHACYHYGRLLREKGDPAEAMQAFIDATHSGTKDYHILGRVYSNMGSICHLAGEFQLSYDMYEKSARVFLQDGDTLSYYYLLNDMAFELAENKDFSSANKLLLSINDCCTFAPVLAKCNETKLILYKHTHQYDSILNYTDSCLIVQTPLVYISKAQAFYYLNKYDSAIHYAQKTLLYSNDLYDLNNAYYLLIHCDSINNGMQVYTLSSKRADVQKLLEIRQGRLSQAAQLLEQDLNHKPDLRWLYAIIGTLIIISCLIAIYVYQKHKKKELLTQKIDVLKETASTIQEQKKILTERYLSNHKYIEDEINSRCSMFQTNDMITKILAWKNYPKMCNIVDKRFYFLASKLRERYSLNEIEVRICVLTLLDCGYERMAELLYRSSSSIGTLKMRVAKKLGTTSKEMRQYLIDNVCIS